MANYIADFIKSFKADGNLDVTKIVVSALLIALITFVYAVFFCYAKKRNLSYLVLIISAAVIILFDLSFFNVPNLGVYVLIVLIFSGTACFVLFGQDFRRDLFHLSWRKLTEMEGADELSREDLKQTVNAIVKACQHMSRNDTGALIVIADNIADTIIDSGTIVDANVSSDLLETIFFDKTPLHDGAVVVMANRIVAASCYLPLTQNLDLPREFGTRHRAAIGISESNPSLTAIVVSEESGIISAMHDGKVLRYLDVEKLTAVLECALRLGDSTQESMIWGLNSYEE